MSWCEDCGKPTQLTYCTRCRDSRWAAVRVEELRPCVAWVPYNGARCYFINHPYPQWWSDEWLEVIW